MKKKVLYLICNCIKGFVGSVNLKSGTANVNTDSQWSKQETPFACEIQVWLAVNRNTSVTSDVWFLCLNTIAQASERCQSQHQCHFWCLISIFEHHCTDKWALAAVNQGLLLKCQYKQTILKNWSIVFSRLKLTCSSEWPTLSGTFTGLRQATMKIMLVLPIAGIKLNTM